MLSVRSVPGCARDVLIVLITREFYNILQARGIPTPRVRAVNRDPPRALQAGDAVSG